MTDPKLTPATPPDKWPLWLRKDEVAIVLRRSVRTVERMIAAEELRFVRIGGAQMMPRRVLREFMQKVETSARA